ncbi:MAG: hypothetical protein A3G82_11685 [Burkholderiales bacterium RIFCSPLOWO2_12_FULL_67_210]|nr:MAG: hypothetical protein A3G82_11685 [Burkholderiales bacterium RIFCSPLOWO2_12_FULL_67_210]
MSFLRSLVTNHPLANIAFVVVLLLGLVSYNTMPREQDPEINFNWVSVSAVLPGASAPAAGTSGTLRWQEARPHLPPALMVRRGSALGVFVRQGTGAQASARFVPLPGAQEGRASAVDLPADTPVIVRGQAALQHGQPIDPQAASGATN